MNYFMFFMDLLQFLKHQIFSEKLHDYDEEHALLLIENIITVIFWSNHFQLKTVWKHYKEFSIENMFNWVTINQLKLDVRHLQTSVCESETWRSSPQSLTWNQTVSAPTSASLQSSHSVLLSLQHKHNDSFKDFSDLHSSERNSRNIWPNKRHETCHETI